MFKYAYKFFDIYLGNDIIIWVYSYIITFVYYQKDIEMAKCYEKVFDFYEIIAKSE